MAPSNLCLMGGKFFQHSQMGLGYHYCLYNVFQLCSAIKMCTVSTNHVGRIERSYVLARAKDLNSKSMTSVPLKVQWFEIVISSETYIQSINKIILRFRSLRLSVRPYSYTCWKTKNFFRCTKYSWKTFEEILSLLTNTSCIDLV